jgi:branched-subunit amino acid aminotransferase/4-amino-4-deoxychorismate lyase
VTRAALLEIARELRIPVEERAMTEVEARGADEVFITSTTREISPFSHWDGKPVGWGCAVTKKLHEALKARVAGEVG